MFFILSKILGFFALPSNILITLGITGCVLTVTRFARTGLKMVVASIMLLAIFGLSPLGNALILPLEDRFPAWDTSRGEPYGLVVLGGAIDNVVGPHRSAVALNEAAERITSTVELALRYPNAKILFSGGSGSLFEQDGSEAQVAMGLFEHLGISGQRIMLEKRSRDTAENAVLSKKLADPKPGQRWLLITSAYHMPRAMGAFRRAGFAVEAYPVDWRTRGPRDDLRPFASVGDGLRRTDTAMREWVGLVIYWLTGRSAALFPAP